MQKIKSIAVIIMVMIAITTMFTACRHHGKKGGKCCKEMCAKDSCCKEACKDDGSCCMKDKKKCCAKDEGEKKACCSKDKAEKKACCAKDGDMKKDGDKKTTAMYQCSMDKEVTSDKPGKCPKCGMELEKTK